MREVLRTGDGSHRNWHSPATGNATVLPDWGGDDLKLGTRRGALRQLGLSWDEFTQACSANEPHPSTVGEGLRGEGPVFGFRDGRDGFAGPEPRADEGREWFRGAIREGKFVECVEGGKKGRH